MYVKPQFLHPIRLLGHVIVAIGFLPCWFSGGFQWTWRPWHKLGVPKWISTKTDYSVSLYTFLILYTILVMLLLMMMSSKLMSGFSSWHRCGSNFWADAWGKHQRNITISSVRPTTYPISSSNFFAISKKTPLKQLYCFRAWTIAPFITK